MSISSNAVRKAGPFNGDGVTSVFPFTFKVFSATDMLVVSTDSNNVSTQLALTTDYTVQLNANQDTNPGGTVTMNVAPAVGYNIVVGSAMPALQPLVLTNTGGFYPTSLNDAFDRAVILIQQLAEKVGRTLQFSIADKATSFATLPNATARSNMLQGYDANGFPTLVPLSASVGAGDMRTDSFTSGVDFTAGVTAQLTLSRAPGTAANLEIFFDGTYQGSDQWSLNGAVVTFNGAIPTGTSKVFARSGTTISSQIPAVQSVGDTQLVWGGILGRVTDSVAAMAALNPAVYTRAFPTGYYRPADGGGGPYVYSATTPQNTANGGTIIASTAQGATGCWLLQYTNSVSFKQFGSEFDGATDDTTTNQAALNALPSIGKLTLPVGFSVTGVLTLPVGATSGWVIQGQGVGVSGFQEKAANQGIFGAPNGIVFGAEFCEFSIKCHPSSNGGGTGILVSGYYNSKFRKIGYLSNGSGYSANLFVLSAYPQLSYGNVIEDIHIVNQVGPGVPVYFGNGGQGVNYNANACRVVGGLIANNTMMGTCIDATRSINTVIDRVWLENNSNAATNTGLQANASGGIASGKGTVISSNYLELLSPYIIYASTPDGPSNDGLVIGNNFSASWQTTSTFFNGAANNLWVKNNENGLPVLFSGAGDTNRKIGQTLTSAQALALLPAVSNFSGVSGSLSVSNSYVEDVDMEGNIYFLWALNWTSSTGGANLASVFSIAALSGYSLKALNVSANIPASNNVPVACSADIAASHFTVAIPSTASYGIFVQAIYKKTW